MMNAGKKAEILAHISAWLDSLEEEPLPPGLDPALAEDDSPPPDLAGLAAAVAAAVREVAIQGKTMKRLDESVAPLGGNLEALTAHVEAIRIPDPEAWNLAVAEARAEGRTAALMDLLELHDRLGRCAVEARLSVRALPKPSRWIGGAKTLEGVARGVELTLERLMEILGRAGVKAMATTGRHFDPETMRAMDTVPAESGVKPGTVIETLRTGFTREGAVLRPAEVRVAKEHENTREGTDR